MSEHLLFLQAAGSDFGRAHELVDAIAEAIRTSHEEATTGDHRAARHHSRNNNCCTPKRPGLDPARIADRLEHAGFQNPENLLVAMAAQLTISSPLKGPDISWTTSAAAQIADENLLLESAGVMFAFNTINRIADARRVRLEWRFVRELKPIRGWVERRLASLVGLAYDMSYKHRARHSSAEMLERATALFERLGAPCVPDVFHWLGRSPVVLEGVLEMFEANILNAGVRPDLLKEAAAIAVASRAMPNSSLCRVAAHWLPGGALPDAQTLRSWGTLSAAAETDRVTACRRYAWQVANAAHTITAEQIHKLSDLGLSDADLLDLTLATSIFSALAIVEPISAAVGATSSGGAAMTQISQASCPRLQNARE